MQGIERTSSRRGSESSQFYTGTRGPSSMSSESRTSDVKGAASDDGEPTKYICPTCSKRFNRPSSLRIHINTHTTGATPFRCPFPNCGREFNVHSNMRRHYRNHTSPELSRAQPVEPRQSRRQAHDPDLVFVTGGTSGQPQPHPFNDWDYHRPHQDSVHHIPRTRESSVSDDSEDYQNHRSLTGYHRCNDDYRHTRHLPVSRSHAPHTRSWPENEDTHVALPSRSSYMHSSLPVSIVSSPSQSDPDSRLDVNIRMSPRKRRRMSTDSAFPSPASSSSDSFFNMSNSVLTSVEYPFPNHSSLDSLHSNSSGIDQPISPLCSSFPAPLVSFVVHESLYGPFPPNTGNSTTSNAPSNINPSSQSHMADIKQGPESANRTYPSVALPGNAVRKMPRRRYDQIERLYCCSWPNCTKAYGTLNHLNAHVVMQNHGPKRSPSEFMELRKQWCKARKEVEGSHPAGAPARRGDNTRYNDPNMYDPASNGGSSSPNAQSNTSYNGSNSNGMAKTFSSWSNRSSMVANENCSRPGSAQSGSSSVSDLSQPSLVFPFPSYNRCSSSPNVQSSTSHNGSNSKGMAETFSNWSNRPSPRAANENRSRPGSAQSGSSGGRSDSP